MDKSKTLFYDEDSFQYINNHVLKTKKRNLDANYFSDENMDLHFFQKKNIYDNLTNWNNKGEKELANKLGFSK